VFQDFHLRFERRAGGELGIAVLTSPAGTTSAATSLSVARREARQWRAQISGLLHGNHDTHADRSEALARLGDVLCATLFPPPIRALLDRSLGAVAAANPPEGLRIKLHLDPFDGELGWLAELPWDVLRVPGVLAARWSVLEPRMSVARYLEAPAPAQPFAFDPPLRVLLVSSTPGGLPALATPAEAALVGRTLASVGGLLLEPLSNATRLDVRSAVARFRPHLVHFMGHGTLDAGDASGLVLDDGYCRPDVVSGEALSDLLGAGSSVRIIVLNACLTAAGSAAASAAASLFTATRVSALVAMQFEISDRAALAFSEGFYSRLADGATVDEAVAEGRFAIKARLPSSFEWCTPALYLRATERIPLAPASTPETPSARQALEVTTGVIEGKRVEFVNVLGASPKDHGGSKTTIKAGAIKADEVLFVGRSTGKRRR
jgi:hypothetical protein